MLRGVVGDVECDSEGDGTLVSAARRAGGHELSVEPDALDLHDVPPRAGGTNRLETDCASACEALHVLECVVRRK
eukprot:EC789757.1.p6 GENE.EC789757.1~~EC789757.1.p6  ORF type:complete len:75 (-),score=10.76 EC789757.1:234-458(-)